MIMQISRFGAESVGSGMGDGEICPVNSKTHSTDSYRRVSLLSWILISLGSCLLILVAVTYAYGSFETWIQDQPRTLTSSEVVWLEVPPMTPLPSPTSTPLPTPTPTPIPTPTPTPTPGPPVQVTIERLGIKRAIVPVGLVTWGGRLQWNDQKLFATSGRRDLVGHLEGTGNPGQPGNVVLIGHNYNRGAWYWYGVFYSLQRLKKGDVIQLLNADNELFSYQVEQVQKVRLRSRLDANTPIHAAYLAPTPDETLTLVTCGGANIAPFPSRVYVTAKRVGGPR
jgi:LPXTG-site transpeptidase (sortase) family protein